MLAVLSDMRHEGGIFFSSYDFRQLIGVPKLMKSSSKYLMCVAAIAAIAPVLYSASADDWAMGTGKKLAKLMRPPLCRIAKHPVKRPVSGQSCHDKS